MEPKGTGQQTGYFIYDVWDPALGLESGSHLTLFNTTATDIFCASGTASVGVWRGHFGGDNWTGTATTQQGQPQQQRLPCRRQTV